MSASPAAIADADATISPPLFVINLCASTSPMALSHPSAPELKRYTFFVSRQREEGRERFRLHMGYFAAQEEADAMLELVRDVYPAAWAGPAPTSGSRRRTRAAVLPATAMPAVVPAAPTPIAITPVVEVLNTMSNVRDVLAQLSEPAAPVQQPAPALELSDPQVLGMLEAPAARAMPAMPELADTNQVRLVTPEDTQALTDIRLDEQNNAPPCFALQLVWSATPIDVSSLSQLAIFDAYTLYNVEGNRQGRKWYGVRLGFFSDPNSATQVANYVRSDYTSVSIVPVSIKERDSAGGAPPEKAVVAPRAADATQKSNDPLASGVDLQGFELLADDRPAPKKLDLDDSAHATRVDVPVAMPAMASSAAKDAAVRKAIEKVTGKPVAKAAPRVAGKSAGKPTGKRVAVRKRPVQVPGRASPGAATPLDSTLEILGASTLSLDEGRAIINDSAERKPLDRKGGNRFSRLLSRLSGS